MSPPRLEQPFVIGPHPTPNGRVPKVSSSLRFIDHWGTFKARWGIGRMNYTVDPGLYALGSPDDKAPVLVTANYKMSFDRLRERLSGRDVWILVLDTKGINVWCAAGKGTFGTTELVTRIGTSGLAKIVSHRRLILPQLAAPGVSAHLVQKMSGFKVVYGPIRAADLPDFLDQDLKATPAMRLKTFSTLERLVLIPVELVAALKTGLAVMLVLFLVDSAWGAGGFWSNAMSRGVFSVFAILAGILAGAVMTPLLLPWLPGRAFSIKGLIPGAVVASAFALIRLDGNPALAVRIEMLAWVLLIIALSTYLAMNFTGSSTYTSLSGVRKEMRWAVPLQIGAGVLTLGFWLGSHLIS